MQDLQQALIGVIILSAELDEMLHGFQSNTVPKIWKDASYLSLMPLNEWMKDFIKRINFFNKWIQDGQPAVFWLPGFYFPQGLLTAVLQQHSRATRIPIDHLAFDFEILDKNDYEVIKPPGRPTFV